MPRLEEKLRVARERASEKMPDHALEILGSHGRELRESGRADDATGEGDPAPDFRLPSSAGGDVQLSELLARGPVVLNFYRGRW